MYLGRLDEYKMSYTKSRVDKIKDLQDELIRYMKERDVAIEVCPTSNIITLGLSSYVEHPIKTFLEYDVPVIICTDSSGVYGITLKDEIKNISAAQKLSLGDLNKILNNSREYSLKKLRGG